MTRNQSKSIDYSTILKQKKFEKSPLALLLQKEYKRDVEIIKQLYAIAPDSFLERSGKKFLKKPILLSTGSWYIGEVSQESIPNGVGYMLNSDGSYFEGNFKAGKPNGYGQLLSQKGMICSGDWEDGDIRHGNIKFDNGKFYSGEIENLMPHGKGKEESAEYLYQGMFAGGLKHGAGHVMWIDDNWYEGDFNKGKIEGLGTHVWEDKVYKGEWKGNKMHGKGELVWKDGRKYQGSMVNGIREGFGTMWEGDREFSGYWKDGKEDGKGKLKVNGVIIKGIWHKGKIVRKISESQEEENNENGVKELKLHEKYRRRYGKIVRFRDEVEGLTDQDIKPFDFFAGVWIKLRKGVYKGDLDQEKRPHGKGVFLSAKHLYEGDFKEGKKSGSGRLLSNCEDVYVGGWLNNKRSGYGIQKTVNTKYEGEWKSNYFHGEGKLTTINFTYKGTWSEGEQHGYGVLEMHDGKTYVGEFQHGNVSGIGVFHYADGNFVKALWKDGESEEILESKAEDSLNTDIIDTVRSLNCIRFREIYA